MPARVFRAASVYLTLAACASPPAPAPAPAPTPPRAEPAQPTPVTRAPARAPDSVRTPPPRVTPTPAPTRASTDTARVATRSPVRRPVRPLGRAARPGARTDTLATRELAAPVRVCAGGDVTLGTNLDREWSRMAAARMRNQYGRSDLPSELIAPLRPLVENADIVLLNVESAIGAGGAPSKCGKRSTNCYAFRAPPSSATAFKDVAPGKVVVGNVANNHSRDAGPEGQAVTVNLLARAGVLVTGYDTIATAVPTPAGDSIGILGFYTSADSPDARDTAAVYRHVARAAARFPVVIVTMHLGAEGAGAQRTRDATEIFLNINRGNPVGFADAAVRGGAAMVIGHGPHVVRAVEWRDRGALIAYSLGNLLTYGPFTLREPLNRGAVLCASIDENGRVVGSSLASTVQLAPGVMLRDSTHRAAAIIDSLGRLDFRLSRGRVDSVGVVTASP